MSFLSERDYATLILDGATVILMIIVMILSSDGRKRGRDDDKFYFAILIVNIIMAVSDSLCYVFEYKIDIIPNCTVISTIGLTIFFLMYVLVMMIWMDYCRIRFKERGASSGNLIRPIHIPGFVMLLIVIINVFTGWIFSYDSAGEYHRGILHIVTYIVMAFYAIIGFVYLGRYKSRHKAGLLIPVWVYLLPIVFGLIFSFSVQGSASFAPICVAMSLTFTYIGTINESMHVSYGSKTK